MGSGGQPVVTAPLPTAVGFTHSFLVSYSYLIRSTRHLAQYLACNLLPDGYWFISTAVVPEGKDPVLIDAKLALLYSAHLPKEKQYRRSKAGHAKVKYVRCGRLCLLLATKGESPFFEREKWFDVRERNVSFGGYAIGVNRQSGKVCVRLHRETVNRLKRLCLEWATRRDVTEWEGWFWNLPFLPFEGVRDDVFSVVRFLNACRKDMRHPPVEWRRCVRKRFTPEPVFLDSPPELLELLRWNR